MYTKLPAVSMLRVSRNELFSHLYHSKPQQPSASAQTSIEPMPMVDLPDKSVDEVAYLVRPISNVCQINYITVSGEMRRR